MSSCRKLHLILLFTSIFSTVFAGMQWKPYDAAKIEEQNGGLSVQFAPGLSGIQTIVSLEKGTHQIKAELSGEARVFFGMYNGKKWFYSPDFKLTA